MSGKAPSPISLDVPAADIEHVKAEEVVRAIKHLLKTEPTELAKFSDSKEVTILARRRPPNPPRPPRPPRPPHKKLLEVDL
jgi:hypothetical protein